MKEAFAEGVGTFMLVFAGTGAIIINGVSGGAITHVGIALTFGLVVMTAIYAVGDVSGAHINPAVTLGFWAARRLPSRKVPKYILGQFGGATLASLILYFMFPAHENLGSTLPSGEVGQSLILEIILTWWLMFVIISVSTGAKEKGITAGLAIGSVVALEALFAGPISGASMNPARSFAPAVFTGNLSQLWIYFAGPILGALLAIPTCICTREVGCCRKKVSAQETEILGDKG